MTRSLLVADRLTKIFTGGIVACRDVSLDIEAGEVVAIVGESGSGKSTLLRLLAGRIAPEKGVVTLADTDGTTFDPWSLDEFQRLRRLERVLALVDQNPRDGLQLDVSAGGNIAEPLMTLGSRHYGSLRAIALEWLDRVEISADRVDATPRTFSGGMQKRLQIARCLVRQPRLLLMDEPTGGLDVSVQARLLDLLRTLTRSLGVALVVVTHDLGVARMLADRVLVMRRAGVVESGLIDQVLDDPRHPYSQQLVSAVLRV